MSYYTVIGIDPGKSGAIAVSPSDPTPANPLRVYPMPLVSFTGRAELDIRELRKLLRSVPDDGALVGAQVFVERLWSMPASMGGGLANFSRGYSLGVLEGLFHALGMPYTLVPPSRWQRDMLGTVRGDTKQRAIMEAQRLFPELELRRSAKSRKLDHGFADAALLAEWGWRQLRSGRDPRDV